MRMAINVQPIFSALDEMVAVSEVVNDLGFLGRARHGFQDVSTRWFGRFADAAAADKPTLLHHVYEWNKVGSPEGRLWRTLFTGSTTTTSSISFDFEPSIEPVPQKAHDRPELRRPQFFTYKAWAFEDGYSAVIEPTEANVLAYVKDGQLMFAQQVRVETPRENIGQFTALWNEYWNSHALLEIETRIMRPMSKKVEAAIVQSIRNAGRRGGGLPPVRGGMGKFFDFTAIGAMSRSGMRSALKKRIEAEIMSSIYVNK